MQGLHGMRGGEHSPNNLRTVKFSVMLFSLNHHSKSEKNESESSQTEIPVRGKMFHFSMFLMDGHDWLSGSKLPNG